MSSSRVSVLVSKGSEVRFAASAPGKLVLLGEYAVLDGAPALVLASAPRCRAEVRQASSARCRLVTTMQSTVEHEFDPGQSTGSTLADAVLAEVAPRLPWASWEAHIDSSGFFRGATKLGLGSSAAATVAFAGACRAAAGEAGRPELNSLIRCHRRFQGGSGSGIDVAAALAGGTVRFALGAEGKASSDSVRLPEGVGFACVFAGGSASTPGLVGRYREWTASGSVRTAALRQRMLDVANGGCVAAQERNGAAFVAAIDDYGRCLAQLGREIGADLVTEPHARIGRLAREFDLAYKVSGAGGGDVGIACGLDGTALRSFCTRAAADGWQVIPLSGNEQGLRIEEHAE
jgi:phosphomevalonate kinase